MHAAVMPKADFLRRLGLFAIEGFFDRDLCGRLRHDVRSARRAAATVRQSGGEYTVDQRIRSVQWVDVADENIALVRTRLLELRPTIQSHFTVEITD